MPPGPATTVSGESRTFIGSLPLMALIALDPERVVHLLRHVEIVIFFRPLSCEDVHCA